MIDHPHVPFRVHILCCVNSRPEGHSMGSCSGRGADKLLRHFKSQCRFAGIRYALVNTSDCMNICRSGPIVAVYPGPVWYSCQTEADVEEIIRSHIVDGIIVERLRLCRMDAGDAETPL